MSKDQERFRRFWHFLETEIKKTAEKVDERKDEEEQSTFLAYGIRKDSSDEEFRYTLGPLYIPDQVDAHGEYTTGTELEKAVWKYVESGNREIKFQHSDQRAGEWLGLLVWPYEVELELTIPTDGGMTKSSKMVKFPPGTPFMGIRWDEQFWNEKVKTGEVRGLSMGGSATRVDTEAS